MERKGDLQAYEKWEKEQKKPPKKPPTPAGRSSSRQSAKAAAKATAQGPATPAAASSAASSSSSQRGRSRTPASERRGSTLPATPAAPSSAAAGVTEDWELQDFANEKVPPPESAGAVDKWVAEMARRIDRRLGPRSEEQQRQDVARLHLLGQ